MTSILKKATEALLKRTERPASLDDTRRQFLPAALEVEDTPASPASRIIIKVIAVLFVITIVWACVGKIDIVATAQGKIIPSERVKTIQPIVIGEVERIHVREGDTVKAGALLITLVDTVTEAEQVRLDKEIQALTLQLNRQQAFVNYLDDGVLSDAQTIENTHVIFEQQLLQQQIKDYEASAATLTSEKKSKQAEQQTTQAHISKLQRVLPIIEERTNALKGLYQRKHGSRVQYLELEQQRIELEENIKAQQATEQQLITEQETLQRQLESLHAQKRRESLDQQEQLLRQLASLEQERIKSVELHDQQQIRAPIDGTVQQLQVHTIGGVVQPAQALMQIVPADANMEVEAWILNKDIGFV
ncbi:hypothetical protein ACH42_00260, partial [Endozoicomonas sp. (ex Bugula neritina AB1)]